MPFRVLLADDAFWRPSNQTKVDNTDLGGQLGAETLASRIWRLKPGDYLTRHRHRDQAELYVVIEGTGRMRIGDELLTLPRLSSVLVDPGEVRQIFNDTADDAAWLITGTPRESVTSTLEMSDEMLAWMYPDGPGARPPELG